MVKTYSLTTDGKVNLSQHFQVFEFASSYPTPYGNVWKVYTDKVLIDTDLIQILEDLFNKLHASKCIVNSGYRTPEHDKRVGGNGRGQHTLGLACDCTFYSQNGKPIDSRYIACVCQCMGVKGIAPITLYSIHIDNRLMGTYKGDERVSNNTVTNDYFKYYNLTMEDVLKYLDNI